MTPTKLTGKQLEDHCVKYFAHAERKGLLTAGRYGVQATFIDDKWQPLKSYPDFEGILAPDGRQFIIEAKVCSSASFPLHDEFFKKRQLAHLLRRSKMRAICLLLIHFNERELKTKTVLARTVAFPVRENGFWLGVESGETRSINHDDCDAYATNVPWILWPRAKIARPDLGRALKGALTGGDEASVSPCTPAKIQSPRLRCGPE